MSSNWQAHCVNWLCCCTYLFAKSKNQVYIITTLEKQTWLLCEWQTERLQAAWGMGSSEPSTCLKQSSTALAVSGPNGW